MSKKGLIIAAAAASVLIVLILGFVNSFTGNPVSAFIASRKIHAYTDEKYKAMNLELSDIRYNFKNSAYGCKASSKTSADTIFYIQYGHGKVTDDYDYEVANHFTTYRRLSHDFNVLVSDIITKNYPYQTTMIIGDLKGDTNKLTPDTLLDLEKMPLKLSLTVSVLSGVQTEAKMSDLLFELNSLLISKGIKIDIFTLRLEEPLPENIKPGSGNTLYLTDFPATEITSDRGRLTANIIKHIQEANNKEEKR